MFFAWNGIVLIPACTRESQRVDTKKKCAMIE
jgi:hypothetical protein